MRRVTKVLQIKASFQKFNREEKANGSVEDLPPRSRSWESAQHLDPPSVEPFFFEIIDQIERTTEYPVKRHRKPYAPDAEPQSGDREKSKERDRLQRAEIAAEDAEDPHRRHRNDQREAHVARRAEDRIEDKAERPDQSPHDTVIENQLLGKG